MLASHLGLTDKAALNKQTANKATSNSSFHLQHSAPWLITRCYQGPDFKENDTHASAVISHSLKGIRPQRAYERAFWRITHCYRGLANHEVYAHDIDVIGVCALVRVNLLGIPPIDTSKRQYELIPQNSLFSFLSVIYTRFVWEIY